MESTTGENEKRLLATTLRERLIENKNTIIYKELLDENLPIFLKNYLQNRVQKFFHTDEPFQIKNSKRYDFSYTKIKEYKQQLHQAFEEATLFNKEEITEIINRTVGLQFDLLVNPQQTLIKIFYKNKSERTQADILQILKGLIDDRIFIKRLREKIKEFDQFHIIEDDFKKLLTEIQNEIYGEDFIPAFISDVKAFLEFISHIKGTAENAINKDILLLLLDERNLNQYEQAFQTTSNNNDWIDLNEILIILQESDGNNSAATVTETNEIDDDLEDIIVSVVEPDQLETEQVKEDISTIEKDSDNVHIKKIDTKGKKHHPKIEAWTDPQNFIIDRSMIEHQPIGPLFSLNSLIDDRSKRLIQKKIFKKDDLAYHTFIRKLEEIDNWKEAKQVIDDELMMRSIQPFSKEALKLGDLVFNRYFPKKN